MRDAMRPQSESHLRIARATDGRTNVTKKSQQVAMNLSVCNARGNEDEPTLIGEMLNSADLWPTERHPIVRIGERDEIPSHVRAAVWYRDRGKCEICGTQTPTDQPWHLDHIKPWSAGGLDDTTNLRVLCERHNMERGNRVDATERPRRAATWWCVNCYDLDDFRWEYLNGLPHCHIHRSDVTGTQGWCRVTNAYRSHRERHGEWPEWHQVTPVSYASVVAYCAHCDAPGLTSRPL